MLDPDGTDYQMEKDFVDVVPLERIVLQHMKPMHRLRLLITYACEAGKTRLTGRMRFDSADEVQKVRQFVSDANERNFDRLEPSSLRWVGPNQPASPNRCIKPNVRPNHAGVQQRRAKVASDVKYDISIVSFFDILGFRTMVASDNPGDILRALSYMTKVSTPDQEIAELYEKHFVNFSDTVVRLTNVLSETNKRLSVGIVFHEVLDLVHIQMNLVNRGVFVRGGVVIGKVHHEPPFTFGPGIVEAYEIESKRAKHPRIVVPNEMFDLIRQAPVLRSSNHSVAQEQEYLRNLLCKCGDDEWFIDYLRASQSEIDDDDEYIGFMTQHKKLITANLARHRNDASVFEKYEWLALYHNEVT